MPEPRARRRPSREVIGALAVLALAAGVAVFMVVSLLTGDDEAAPRLSAPFAEGQTWYRCVDTGAAALVLSPTDEDARGGCVSAARTLAMTALFAPGDSRVAGVDGDAVCLDLTAGGSVRLAALAPDVAPGDELDRGAPLGSLAGDGRLRLEFWDGLGCSGDLRPFADAYDSRLLCADDDPEVVVSCPTGELGAVDMQQACDAQYAGEGRDAVILDATDAYTWACVGPAGDEKSIEVSAECVRLHGRDARTMATDPHDPHSWVCVR